MSIGILLFTPGLMICEVKRQTSGTNVNPFHISVDPCVRIHGEVPRLRLGFSHMEWSEGELSCHLTRWLERLHVRV